MNKSYIITKLFGAGYNTTICREVYDRMKEAFLSDVAMSALTSVLVAEENNKPLILRYMQHRLAITKYIDELPIDDYAKSVLIKQAAFTNSDESHEAWKHELKEFVSLVKES